MSSKSSFYNSTGVTNTQSNAIDASVDNAEASATASENSANNASASASTATTKASEASTSASTATTKASEASTSASTATTKASEASTSAATATTKATESATSATASANSATAASTSASTATTKASEASSSASTALSHKNDAQTAKTAAETAETNAETAETNAASSATAASTSASSASTSASTATTKAGEAATSASTATTKASEAATSASNASTAATTATTKASEASASASSAASSATAASASKDAALAALDSFDDRYLGVKSSNPSVDNDGNALVAGSLYFNSTDDTMKVYEGSAWVAAYASLSGALIAASNLSDLSNVATARTNLGLGTAATTAASAYATAAQGTKADNALPKAGGTMTGNLDVGGTVTADGLTVETSSGAIATLSNSSTSTDSNTVIGKLVFENNDDSSAATNAEIMAKSDGTAGRTDVYIRGGSGSLSDRFKVGFNGDISFYEDTGTTAKFFWDSSAESLGIGTSSPSTSLDVVRAGVQPLRVQSTSGTEVSINMVNTGGNVQLEAHNGNFNIDADAVGIGTSSPAVPLEIIGTTTSGIRIKTNSAHSNGFNIYWDSSVDNAVLNNPFSGAMLFETANTERMRIDSSGRVGIGVTPSGDSRTSFNQKTFQVGNSGSLINLDVSTSDRRTILAQNAILNTSGDFQRLNTGHFTAYQQSGGVHKWFYDGSGSAGTTASVNEAMRIDSSGNVLVGTTTTTNLIGGTGNDGVALTPNHIEVGRSGGAGLFINRYTSDGDIAVFRKDGSTVGSIGTNTNGNFQLHGSATSHVGLQFGSPSILPINNSGASSDNAVDLGDSNVRFKDLYLSGGVYLGGTGSANKLDDYEEGTWTPSFPNGGTIGTFNSATYTKVGQLVFAGFYISTLSGIPNTSTAFLVGGLPFNVTSGSGYQAGGGISYVNGANWASTGGLNTPLAQVNTANFYFHRDDGNANTVQSAQASVLNGQEMICSIIYQTSA